jgi:hypothetical protein
MRNGWDKRRSRRFDWSKWVRLSWSDGHEQPCQLNDISQHGARVTLPAGAAVPDMLQLVLRQGARPRPARVVWRSGLDLGLEFETATLSRPSSSERRRRPAAGPVAPLDC